MYVLQVYTYIQKLNIIVKVKIITGKPGSDRHVLAMRLLRRTLFLHVLQSTVGGSRFKFGQQGNELRIPSSS